MTLLILLIYIAFISLGVPDSLFGAAWPAIYTEFNINLSIGGLIGILTSICMVISSSMAGKVVKKFGTFNVTIFSTFLTALGLLGYAFSQNIYLLFFFTIFLGLGAGAVDSALNNYVAVNYSSSVMSFLHCFYGIGVSISPAVLSLILSITNDWHKGYLVMAIVQLVITGLLFFTIPLSRQQNSKTLEEKIEINDLSIKKALKIKGVIYSVLIFITCCGLENTAGSWAATYLVTTKGVSIEKAAGLASIFYIGLTLGRLISGFIVKKLTPKKMIYIGELLIFVGLILMIIPVPLILQLFGILLVGAGIGPIYPNLMFLTPIFYGKENSQSIIGYQQVGASIGCMVIPMLYGLLAGEINPGIYPIYLFVNFLLILICTTTLFNTKKGIISHENN